MSWDRIQFLMQENGLSKTEIARISKASNSAVTKWIKGGEISSKYLKTLALHFGVTVDWMLGIANDRHHSNRTRVSDLNARPNRQHVSDLPTIKNLTISDLEAAIEGMEKAAEGLRRVVKRLKSEG